MVVAFSAVVTHSQVMLTTVNFMIVSFILTFWDMNNFTSFPLAL